MTDTLNPILQQQLAESLKLLKITLGSDLLAVYLYGSAVSGGLQRWSDVDLFAVSNRATTFAEKNTLTSALLDISGIYMKGPKRPLEVTIVEKALINPWQYPPRADFQYGEWLRDSFEKGIIEAQASNEMPDLAVIITQILLKSTTLWGQEPKHLLAPVPYHDFITAMLHDLPQLATHLNQDTRNVLLTYARIWSTMATNTIRPKPAAADWALRHLPVAYQPVLSRAKAFCIGTEEERWDDVTALLQPCADFMTDAIRLSGQKALQGTVHQKIYLA